MLISYESRKTFGAFITDCALRYQPPLESQKEIAAFVSQKTGIKVPESAVNTYVGARWESNPNLNYLIAFIDSGLLRFPPEVEGGRLLEFNDVMEILRGHLDPLTGERRKNGNGAAT